MLGLRDSEKVEGFTNKVFSLVIISIVRKFDVYLILFDEGSSCDIMYSELFKKMYLNQSSLLPYEVSDLQAFSGTLP